MAPTIPRRTLPVILTVAALVFVWNHSQASENDHLHDQRNSNLDPTTVESTELHQVLNPNSEDELTSSSPAAALSMALDPFLLSPPDWIDQIIAISSKEYRFILRTAVLSFTDPAKPTLLVAWYAEKRQQPELLNHRFAGISQSIFQKTTLFLVHTDEHKTRYELACKEVTHPQKVVHSLLCVIPPLQIQQLMTKPSMTDAASLQVVLVGAANIDSSEHEIVFSLTQATHPPSKRLLSQCIRPLFGDFASSFNFYNLPKLIINGLTVGIQHFYIYHYMEPVQLQRLLSSHRVGSILNQYTEEGLISFVHWPQWKSNGFMGSSGSCFDQSVFMGHCASMHIHETEYVLHADLDEYIYFDLALPQYGTALGKCSSLMPDVTLTADCIKTNGIPTLLGLRYGAADKRMFHLDRWNYGRLLVNTTTIHQVRFADHTLTGSKTGALTYGKVLAETNLRTCLYSPHEAWSLFSHHHDHIKSSNEQPFQQHLAIVRHLRTDTVTRQCIGPNCQFDEGHKAIVPLLNVVQDSKDLRTILSM